MNKFSIKQVSYDELLFKYKVDGKTISNNGYGAEYASYLILFKGKEIYSIESDAMEPEDTRFYRDLSFIEEWINLVIKG